MAATRMLLPMLMLTLAAVPAFAADCANSTTQAQMNACIGDDFAKADKTLNILYQRLMKKLEPQEAKMLQDAQRSWLAFRDKHCAFVANPNAGGSIYPGIVSACAASVTSTRAGQLSAKLNCAEGDMGCGS